MIYCLQVAFVGTMAAGSSISSGLSSSSSHKTKKAIVTDALGISVLDESTGHEVSTLPKEEPMQVNAGKTFLTVISIFFFLH